MFWVLVLVAVLLLFYYFLIKPQLYWKQRNVKQGPPVPIMGDSLKQFLRQEAMFDTVRRVYNRHKDSRYSGMYQTTLPTLVLRDPDLIKQITVKDFDHFVDHRNFIPESVDPIWSKNLFALKGDQWREMRATLSPTFTASKMRSMFALMEKSAQQYVNYYVQQDKKQIDIELKDSFTRFANDVIANCAFGIHVDSLKEPKNEFYMNGKEVTDFSGVWKNLKFLLLILAPRISTIFKLSMFPAYTGNFFKSLIRDTVRMREEKNIIRPDMINLLMEARKGRLQYEETTEQKDAGFATVEESHVGKTNNARKFAMTETDMAAQVLIFFFAGFDTISTMMAFMCYELAVNPDIQERLRQEVDDTYIENNGKLTYDLLSKMTYMDMVTSESLRAHPPAIAVDRICTKQYTIKAERPDESPLIINPGDVLWLPIAGIHHDEQYFPNPEKFDPERFSEENKSSINPYAYIPFGAGPRNCIGSRFALMEVKTLVFHILSKFEITVIEKTRIPMKLVVSQFNPAIEGGFWVGFKRRENSPAL